MNATAFAAPAGVNLRFDDNDAAAKLFGRHVRVGGSKHHFSLRHRHAVPRENRFRLILVDFHESIAGSLERARCARNPLIMCRADRLDQGRA